MDIPLLPANITDVDLSHNQLWRFTPSHTTEKLSMKLKKSTSVFSGQKSLTYLDLAYNELNSISDSPFADLSSLQTLIMNHSGIVFMSKFTFKGLHNLKVLHLCFNQFHSVPSGIFSDLSKLQTLYMKSYYLTEIPSQVMAPLTALVGLRLDIVNFTSQKLGKGFENLTNLSYFYLRADFDIKENNVLMDNKTFQYLQKSPLKSLILIIMPASKANKIGLFQTDTFCKFKSLHSFITNSHVSKLHLDSMKSELDMISVKIYLPPSTDYKLTGTFLMPIAKWSSTLKFLRISSSHIVTIGNESFAKFSKLQKLIICYARLENFESHAFSGLNHLQELDLSNNEMTLFPSKALSENSISESLRMLDLSYNKITSVHIQNALPISLRDLILDYNPVTSLKGHQCGFQNITNLSLSHLRESPIYFHFCAGALKLLRKLDLSMPLHRYVFTNKATFPFSKNTPYLETLKLSQAYIFESDMIEMQNFSLLKHFEAAESFQHISDLPSLWSHFIQFPKLTFLNLASNMLISITKMK